MGAHDGGTYLVRAIVHIFVKEVDTERKQIFTEPLETLMEKHTILIHFPGNGKKCQWLAGMPGAYSPGPK